MLKSEAHSLEFERLSQFGGVAGVDLKDAAERVWMTPVCKFYVHKDANHRLTPRVEA